jgi:soluble lytic murein transglycosylase-like protein
MGAEHMGPVTTLRSVGIALAFVLAACSTAAPVTPEVAASAPASTPTETPRATATPRATDIPATVAPTEAPAPDWTTLPVAAEDPASLAKQVLMVESALRDPKVTGAQLKWLGHAQQLTYGRLADYPEWRDGVLAALPTGLRGAVATGIEAGDQLRMLHGAIPKTLPDWKIVDAAPVEDLMSYYKEAQAQFGVPWYYLAAIHLVETRMGRIRGLSSAGAQGPMQFMPATWALYGRGDINDTHDAILGAARYLVAAGAPGNMPKALFAYNHAQAYVNALIDYADVMKTDPLAYRGYHGWQVYYPTPDGPILLPVGWVKS